MRAPHETGHSHTVIPWGGDEIRHHGTMDWEVGRVLGISGGGSGPLRFSVYSSSSNEKSIIATRVAESPVLQPQPNGAATASCGQLVPLALSGLSFHEVSLQVGWSLGRLDNRRAFTPKMT